MGSKDDLGLLAVSLYPSPTKQTLHLARFHTARIPRLLECGQEEGSKRILSTQDTDTAPEPTYQSQFMPFSLRLYRDCPISWFSRMEAANKEQGYQRGNNRQAH